MSRKLTILKNLGPTPCITMKIRHALVMVVPKFNGYGSLRSGRFAFLESAGAREGIFCYFSCLTGYGDGIN